MADKPQHPSDQAPKAQCDAHDRSKVDEQKCQTQAYADAVKAVAQCMLPLEPQHPPKHPAYTPSGIGERLERWWHDHKEKTSYACARSEISAKTDIYHVPDFPRAQQDEIMQQGMRLSEQWRAQGRVRKRDFGRD